MSNPCLYAHTHTHQGFIQDFRVGGWGGGGIKCVHKHVTCALLRSELEKKLAHNSIH